MEKNTSNTWNEIRRYLDYQMLVVTLVLFFLGVLAIHSASHVTESYFMISTFAVKQLMWGAMSIIFYIAILKIGYEKILEFTIPLFVALVVMFILLLILGHTSKGAQSWFNFGILRFQPSEIGKVIFAMSLSYLCVKLPPSTLKIVIIECSFVGIILLLILLQPDLGSCLVYAFMFFVVLIVAGAPSKILAAMITMAFSMLPVLWFVLKPYQRLRLLVFIDPTVDPQGAGYNVIQSRIAVGSGGFIGKGFLNGTQGRLHFLPEPHTDFIFSVFAEEFGFIGSILVLILFMILISRMFKAAFDTRDKKAKILVSAIIVLP